MRNVTSSFQVISHQAKASIDTTVLVDACKLNGKRIAKRAENMNVSNYNKSLQNNHCLPIKTPSLYIVNLDDKLETSRYIDLKAKQLRKSKIVNIEIIHEKNYNINQARNLINNLNEDENVNGVIIQQPLPKSLSSHLNELNALIAPSKDVDCFNPINIENFYKSNEMFKRNDSSYEFVNDIRSGQVIPVPILTISYFLAHLGASSFGKNVVVLKESKLVGSHASRFLQKRGANVSIINDFENGLNFSARVLLQNADIIISDVNKQNTFNYNDLKEGAIVIDAGTFCDEESGKILGDFDIRDLNLESNAKNIHYTPSPGGYGPVSTTMVMRNLLACWHTQQKLAKSSCQV